MEQKDYTKMGNDYCPTCNYKLDCATAVEENHVAPNPHDVSICLNCAEWLEYSDDMALIIMPISTKQSLSQENLITLSNATIFIKKRGLIK